MICSAYDTAFCMCCIRWRMCSVIIMLIHVYTLISLLNVGHAYAMHMHRTQKIGTFVEQISDHSCVL